MTNPPSPPPGSGPRPPSFPEGSRPATLRPQSAGEGLRAVGSGGRGFELSYPAGIELIPVVRRFVFDLCRKATDQADLASRVALCVHELLENAVKYGARPPAALNIEFLGAAPRHETRVSVANLVTSERLTRLQQVFDEMSGYPDPMKYYLELMRRPAHSAGSAGLGLGRIRAEAQMKLSLQVSGLRATVVGEAVVIEGTS